MIDLTVRSVTLAVLCVICAGAAASSQSNDQINTARPCAGQPKTFEEFRRAFNTAKLPSPAKITGTWIGIGVFGSAQRHGSEVVNVNCGGLFDEILAFEGYTVRLRLRAAELDKAEQGQRDRTNSVSFPAPSAGDEARPFFRCRITKRDTLACLIDVYQEGYEFRRMGPEN